MNTKELSTLLLGTVLAAGAVTSISGCESPLEKVEKEQAAQKAATMKCAAGKCGANMMESNDSE